MVMLKNKVGIICGQTQKNSILTSVDFICFPALVVNNPACMKHTVKNKCQIHRSL